MEGGSGVCGGGSRDAVTAVLSFEFLILRGTRWSSVSGVGLFSSVVGMH